MKKEMICILCPRGCHITVDTETFEVTGNSCPRGAQFGAQEITDPQRLLTTTAKIVGAIHQQIPVRSTNSISIAKLDDCLAQIKTLNLQAPIKVGDILIADICGTGVDIVASRSM